MAMHISRPARWRIASLTAVHLLIAAHLIHWRLAGRTLSSIQLSEAGRITAEGVATAGLFSMLLVIVTTAIFGRFFCAWGCHMLAFQEVCRFILRRLGIRPKLLRFRFLWIIPAAACLHVFFQPLVERWWFGEPLLAFHLELSSDNVWANLPGPFVGALTFAVCGLAMVYFMGSLSFCKYVCPYAPLFSFADRLSLGRIRLVGDCDGCARCTAACTTGVRVHEEVALNSMVASHDCMRCFECVSACPQKSLAYRLGRPSCTNRRVVAPPVYPLSGREELLLLAVFGVGLAALNGLYDAAPLLLAAGGGLMAGYATVLLVRLEQRSFVILRGWVLKDAGRVTKAGWSFVGVSLLLFALLGQSLFVQFHQARATIVMRDLGFPQALGSLTATQIASANTAVGHLVDSQRYGLFDTFDQNMRLAWLYRRLAQPRQIEAYLRRAIAIDPRQAAAHFNLGKELQRQGRSREARQAFAEAERLEPSLKPVMPVELNLARR
ncbi:MAG: 4Fe-4S binding protein [Deltaproteobacteria bacterium]|nr:4Fe-4S binding protein [Deltaproteobacteria bacterium]